MFKIYDGREQFYQWDLNRKLIIDDSSINQVHFCNKTDDCSLVCDVYEQEGKRLVDVPNILLQDTWRINVYGYDKEYTKHCAKFDIVARSKPEDYVYTETEVKTWNELEERIAYIEENGTGGGTTEATSCIYVGNTEPIDDVLVWINPEEAATEYATKVYVDEAVSDLEEAAKDYATKDYVDDAIANIDIPESSGGDGGAKVFTFEHYYLSTLTDAEKEMAVYLFNYVKEHNKPPEDYVFYFKGGSNNFIAQEMHYDNRNLVTINCFTEGVNNQYVLGVDSNGNCSLFDWYARSQEVAKEWKWQGGNSLYIFGVQTSHIKIVGYWDDVSSYMATFDISTQGNNYFYEEPYTRYYVPNVYGYDDNAKLYFENNGDNMSLVNADTGSYYGDYEFKVLGYYYWG